jgi:lipopolysaccharide export system protein LptA
VRGHDQTSGLRRMRATAWLVLAAATTAAAQVQEPPTPGASATTSADPIDLAADRIRFWDEDGRRWAILEGHVAILQEGRGLRADRAVVRVARDADTPTLRVEAYAEGHVRSTEGGREQAAARLELATDRRASYRPYVGKAQALQGPPAAEPMLGRAFPRPAPAAPRLAPPSPAASARDDARQVVEPGLPQSAPPSPAASAPPATAAATQAPAVPPVNPSPGGQAEDPRVTIGAPIPIEEPKGATAAARLDPTVRRTQVGDDGFHEDPGQMVPPEDVPEDEPVVEPPARDRPPSDVEPLPSSELPAPAARAPAAPANAPPDVGVLMPGSQRLWSVAPRDANPKFTFERLRASDGTFVYIVRGGVNILSEDPQNGTIDISADNAVIFSDRDVQDPSQGVREKANSKFQVYLEKNVIFRQDARKVAGNGDQKSFKSDRLFYDFRTERLVAYDGVSEVYAPSLLAPIRTISPEINQYKPLVPDGRGGFKLGPAQIRAEQTINTGSRFPQPGYRFTTQSTDLTQVLQPLTDPVSGRVLDNPKDPNARQDLVWQLDSRQNVFFIGPVPFFYWPRIVGDSDDLDPPLRSLTYRYGNYFGHQVLLDFNAFRVLGIKKPTFIDGWNFDVDILSIRGPALGSEIGFFGRDILGDLTDPHHKNKNGRNVDRPYFGYLDLWGIRDHGNDVLGSGPAVVTYGPPGFGKRGFQRIDVPPPPEVPLRGRITFRYMQSLLPSDAPDDADDRLQLEVGYLSDRHFLEEYYKRLFDSGLDQETLAYYIRQRENRAFTVMTEANLQNFYTDTQWLPRLEYFRLADSVLNDWVTVSQNSGIDYANTHTAVEVANPNIFAFMPYDPVSNTSYPLRTGRAYTSEEVDVPLDLGVARVVPYGQGQLAAWDNQLGNQPIGRAWGAVGARASVMAWRPYYGIDSELLNIHDLNHKVNFDVDFRSAYSNVHLNRIGVQDDLDDNTYEFTRRYFALTNYAGGILPPQYDPRLLTLRRAISPIAGTTDIQDTIMTMKLGLHQRLQTKRGPEGKRRIIDYMVLDVTTTYFPNERRDNFGKSFGQNMYNFEWFIGDRTSIISTGWFEFWNVQGDPILLATPRRSNDPFGLDVIQTGISISRPPRGNVYIGYSIINTGPITTSAVTATYGYWLSPKWYSSFSTIYDFGNAILLGSTVAITRIGADFLTSVGLSVDPQRNNYTFNFEITPRFSPNVRFGSAGGGASRFDSRFAPTQ